MPGEIDKELELLQLNKPKLSMKLLHELIRGLQHDKLELKHENLELKHENIELTLRMNELERQWALFHQMKEESAAALSEQSTEMDLAEPDIIHTISVPRSQRHPKPKKRFF